MLRRLIADFKEFPATMFLCASWVVVFLLMVFLPLRDQGRVTSPSLGNMVLGMRGGHQFGDMTLNDLARGEYWRLVTATFVHYGILHIGMNLYGLYLLGTMVESWYGAGQFVAVYSLMAGGGNLFSWLARSALNHCLAGFPPAGQRSAVFEFLRDRFYSAPDVPSGGGSVVVLGLVALCAVVGWRSRTRFGDYLRSQMVGILIFTAVLGQVIPIIDNWGHAGGALVGAVIAFAHRALIRTPGRPIARWAGVLATTLLAACGVAQGWEDRTEARDRGRQIESALKRMNRTDRTLTTLAEVARLYRDATARRRVWRGLYVPLPRAGPRTNEGPNSARSLNPTRKEQDRQAQVHLNEAARLLSSLGETLDRGPTATSYRRLTQILAQPFADTPTTQEYAEFDIRLRALGFTLQKEKAVAQVDYLALQRKSQQN